MTTRESAVSTQATPAHALHLARLPGHFYHLAAIYTAGLQMLIGTIYLGGWAMTRSSFFIMPRRATIAISNALLAVGLCTLAIALKRRWQAGDPRKQIIRQTVQVFLFLLLNYWLFKIYMATIDSIWSNWGLWRSSDYLHGPIKLWPHP